MVTLEQVEKLREYANVSYDQAREALEDAEGDILEAIIILEKQNVIQEPINGGYHNTRHDEGDAKDNFQERQGKSGKKQKNDGASFSELMGRLFKWLCSIIKKGNVNHFEVVKDDNKVITIPVTVMGFALLFMFWAILPLMVVGLFLGYRYTFIGPDLGKENINRAMDSVADAAENLKKEMKSDGANGENSDN